MDDRTTNGKGQWLETARHYLESRGVLAKTADELRVELIEHPLPELLEKFLRFSPQPVPEAILVFPNLVPDTDQLLVDGYSLRFFPPHQHNGKEHKFLRTKDGDYRPYIPPAIWSATSRLEVPIFIVEKQVAAMLLYQLGFKAIALEGTWGAGQPQTDEEKAKNARRVLHRDLTKFSWAGRTVYLCFDTDFTRRESVLEGLIRTFTLLTVAGADVRVLRWDESFKGLDDFVATQAGLDLDKQKQLIVELTDPFGGLDPKEAAALWVKPNYLPLFEREGRLVAMSAAARNNLGRLVTKPLGASVGSLEKSWGPSGDAQAADNKIVVEDLVPWPEKVDGRACAEEVCGIIGLHVHMRAEEKWALTCWIFLCALMDETTILPFAGITSPIKRCGKTNLIGVLRRLCRKALAASAISSAGVYRTVDRIKPTLLIDEADTFLPENDELRGILNSGHTVESAFKILINPDTRDPERFSTFCPKAIALNGSLPSTLIDRSIPIKLSRKPKHIKLKPVRKVHVNAYAEVSSRVMRWVNDHDEEILNASAELPKGLNDRAEENWEILAQIAAVLGSPWPTRILDAATLIESENDSEGQMLGIYLLKSLWTLFKERNLDKPAARELVLESSVICETLNDDPYAPWADWGKKDSKGITQKKLANVLRDFSVKPFKTKENNKDVRGYRWTDLWPRFEQYLFSREDTPADDEGVGHKPKESPEPAANNKEGDIPLPLFEKGDSIRRAEANILSPNDLRGAGHENQSAAEAGPKTASAPEKLFMPNDLDSQRRIESSFPEMEGGMSPSFVLSTAESILSYLDALPGNLSRVALDIETFVPNNVMSQGDDKAREHKSKKIAPRIGTALDWRTARIRLISLTIPELGTHVIDLGSGPPDTNSELGHALKLLLFAFKEIEIIGHHLAFDLCFLEHDFGWRPSKVWDTWIGAKLLLNDDLSLVPKHLWPKPVSPGPTSLGGAVKTWLDVELDKTLGGGAWSDFGLSELSAEQYAYSANDSRYLLALAEKLQSELTAAGMEQIAKLEMALVPVISHMEIVGIPLRADLLDAELADLTAKRANIDAQIETAMRASGFDPSLDYSPLSKTYLQPPKKARPLNINSTNIKEAYFQTLEKRLQVTLPRTEKSNRISFTRETLEKADDPVAALYSARAALDALITGITQRREFIGVDGRVHPVHDQLSASSGRISTEEPPMSNVPHDGVLRQAIAAPENYVLEQGDLSLIEVRAQAHFTEEPTMTMLLNLPAQDPRHDIYRWFAAQMETKHQHRDVSVDEIPAKGPLRARAKAPVLGLAYMMGKEEFIDYAHRGGTHFSAREAVEVIELYFQQFPGIRQWHEEAWAKAKADLVTEGRSQLGRRRLVRPPLPGDDSHRYRQAQALVNFLIQASCADGQKLALVLISSQLPLGAELILSVHDEVLILCHAHQALEVGGIVTEAMQKAYRVAFGGKLKVPVVFEMKPLQNWAQKD